MPNNKASFIIGITLNTMMVSCQSFVFYYHQKPFHIPLSSLSIIWTQTQHGKAFPAFKSYFATSNSEIKRASMSRDDSLKVEIVQHSENRLTRTCVQNLATSEKLMGIEKDLAMKLNVPLLTNDEIIESSMINHCISVQGEEEGGTLKYSLGLVTIQQSEAKARFKRMRKTPPYIVDLSNKSRLGKRLKQATRGKKEIILRAVVPKGVDDIVVFDLTAGFGRDSAIIATSSSIKKVVMIERDPIVTLLLHDALRRINSSENDCHLENILSEKLELVSSDSRMFLTHVDVTGKPKPDVCFLDVMFPPRTKSSAVKKNMVSYEI